MSWVLDRRLADCDEQELGELAAQLTFLCTGGFEFPDALSRADHQRRLAEVLDLVDVQITIWHLLGADDWPSRAGSRSL